VGTKLKVAFQTKRHDTIGQDLVNHCVNDIAVLGAEPLFFLDYLGAGELKPEVFEDIIRGFAIACSENGCSLIGGETAQMPGFYQKGEYDVSGTIVGVVEKSKILSGEKIKPGDRIIGLQSNGLHTNGYSLARKIFFETLKWTPKKKVADFGHTLGEELLRVHRSYWPVLKSILKKFNPNGKPQALKGMAHITGGGLIDNLPRILPENCNAWIRPDSWPLQAVFQIIEEAGKVDPAEMHEVFNMGVGMTLVVSDEKCSSIIRSLHSRGVECWEIGEIVNGTGIVQLEGINA
jgi:phosphoribosylformylglycinamidine cyclo-ligase